VAAARRVRPGPLTGTDRLAAPPTAPRLDHPRRAAVALGAVFALLGLVGASWGSRIPVLQRALHLSDGALGLALLGVPLGSALATVALPRLLHGSARSLLVAGLPAAALSLLLLPLASGPLTLLAALVALGVTTGTVDVAMNAQAVLVQDALPRSVVGRWHAMWSVGGAVAAAAGLAAVAHGVGTFAHLAVVAAVVALVGAAVAWSLPALTAPAASSRPPSTWSANPAVLVLAAVSVAGFVVEVTAADWGGVFVHEVLGSSTAGAAGTYGAFAVPHFLVRLTGDPLIERLPTRRLVTGGLAVAAAGFLLAVTAVDVPVALVGLACAGAGVALVVPVAFIESGRVPGVASGSGVATAAGISYLGWGVTPPLVGGLAAAGGTLRVGLLVPVAAAMVATALARRLP
jgi:predicted MFS family arabinose efflux permease